MWLVLLCLPAVAAPKEKRPPAPSPWAAWVEPDFPFFSSVLDARHTGVGASNLTPRGIVLNLGRDCWVCFDTDLLRTAAIWRGPGVTAKALAPGSYHDPSRKTPGGQFPAPQPDGKLWLLNGIYPGWQVGERPTFEDPREPAPSPGEVGRGPLPEEMGRFKAVRQVRGGAVLEYTVGDAEVREFSTVSEHQDQPVIERHFNVGPSAKPLLLVVGSKNNGAVEEIVASVSLGLPAGSHAAEILDDNSMWIVRVPPHAQPVSFCVAISDSGTAPTIGPRPIPAELPSPRWPQEAASKVTLSSSKDAYVVDDVALPHDNPWRRDLRLGDIQFLKDGTGVAVTLDGDVWLIRGLSERWDRRPAGRSGAGVPPARKTDRRDARPTSTDEPSVPPLPVRWKRFTSGLHEPMSLAVRDEQIFVFDRNGIWHLRDTNADGEADVHELFSNAFAQTADLREFPSTLRLAPKGEFIIAKGGQQATTLGKHNGSVLRISADGRRSTVLGHGFRQPNAGVNIRTGLVTASDQEGQYIPTTPLHIVRDGQFYGFLSDLQPREKYPAPIADPLTWVPHAINASAISQVWLFDAKMGPLNDSLVHIGFNKPEIFRVLFNERTKKPQAAVVSVTSDFAFPPMNGSVNPADGQLYVAGFQVVGWGTTATRVSGLARVRYAGGPGTLPREVIPMDKGVLLRFESILDKAKATDPASYSLASWSYKRTYKYGSALYRADGTPGQDFLTPSSAYLSNDERSVFIGVPDMKPVQQLRIGWSLSMDIPWLKREDVSKDVSKDVRTTISTPITIGNFEGNAYTTPYELPKFDPQKEGFGEISVDLTPRAAAVVQATPATAEEGRRLAQMLGCVACHPLGPQDFGRIGPTWKGLFGTERDYFTGEKKKKGKANVDDAYLRESILEPSAKIVAGYERGEYAMPSYAGALTDSQVESLILFIKTLK